MAKVLTEYVIQHRYEDGSATNYRIRLDIQDGACVWVEREEAGGEGTWMALPVEVAANIAEAIIACAGQAGEADEQ